MDSPTSVRLPNDIKQVLARQAAGNRRSISAEIVLLLQDSLARQGLLRPAANDEEAPVIDYATKKRKLAEQEAEEHRRTPPALPNPVVHHDIGLAGAGTKLIRPRGQKSELFSLVCAKRAEHKRGVYCPTCRGDRPS